MFENIFHFWVNLKKEKKNLNAKLEKGNEKKKVNLHDTERNKDQIPFKK